MRSADEVPPETGSTPGPRVRVLSAAACAAGPAAAVLHEADVLSVGPSATLWPVGFVTAAAAVGLALGHRIWRRDSRALGAVVAVPNGLVLALYGFLLLFFGLGGSR